MAQPDNSTPMTAAEFDVEIHNTMPYYNEFGIQALDIARHLGFSSPVWLDTGCGTGTLGLKILEAFPGTKLTLWEPSEAMLKITRTRFDENKVTIKLAGSQYIDYENKFDIVTAIQCHHYLKEDERIEATTRIFRALKNGGLYVTYENIRSEDDVIADLELARWSTFRTEHGISESSFKDRLGVFYFPISVKEHLKLLKETGFSHISLCWRSYMQAGFYAIK